MALQKTTNFVGVDFTNAYHRVEWLKWSKTGDMFAQVISYSDNTATHEIGRETYAVVYDTAGGEALTQAYTHLKTLDEFSGATDV